MASSPKWGDLALVAATTLATFAAAATLELNEALLGWTRNYEWVQLDELLVTLLAMAVALVWFAWRRAREAGDALRQRRAAERERDRHEQQLRLLSREYLRLQESERRSLARELHDELGQYLNAIKIDAVGIRNRTQDVLPAAHAGAAAIIEHTDHVYGVVRAMMSRLRPTALDELGLVAAMQHCLDGWRQRLPETHFDIAFAGVVDGLDEAINITLYRLVQESLTNVAKHAQATRVHIRLAHDPELEYVQLAIADNGRGMDAAAPTAGLGLVGMRERVENLGGLLTLKSAPGCGLSLRISLPTASRGFPP